MQSNDWNIGNLNPGNLKLFAKVQSWHAILGNLDPGVIIICTNAKFRGHFGKCRYRLQRYAKGCTKIFPHNNFISLTSHYSYECKITKKLGKWDSGEICICNHAEFRGIFKWLRSGKLRCNFRKLSSRRNPDLHGCKILLKFWAIELLAKILFTPM